MPSRKAITVITILIALLAIVYTLITLLSQGGGGPQAFTSIHGQMVETWGYGIYQNMSAEVAPQGLAHDVVTLVIGVPLLLIALQWARSGSLRGRVLLAGVLGFFMVTFVFFLMMAMYHDLFLLLVALAGLIFFGFVLAITGLDERELSMHFKESVPNRFFGGFLMFNAVMIGLLWLSVVVPPLLEGTVPPEVEHYTTLVVQGLDLSILLPASFVSGWLFYHGKSWGYVWAPVYLVFLSLMMTALTAKLIAMSILDVNVVPAIFIIPIFLIVAVIGSVQVLRSIEHTNPRSPH